jgi:hypothetical protein
MRYRNFILALAALCFVGCFHKTTKDTELIIKTLVQSVSGGENVATSVVFAYACYTGTDKWMVASYEDALNRIVTDSLGVERITAPDVESTPYQREGDENPYISLPLNQSPALVVLVCPQERMYATMFKHLNVDNMHQTYMTLLLHSWKKAPYTEGTASKGGVWTIVPPSEPSAE